MNQVDDVLTVETPLPPREDRIRALFKNVGPMGTLNLARACVADGIYTDVELDLMHLRAIQGDVRDALKKNDAKGLPANGHTTDRDDDGAPVWKARELWSPEDYVVNVRELVGQRNTLNRQAVLLAEECAERHGYVIEISSLSA